MARADGTGRDAGAAPHSGASDARLTELLRADTATAYPALQELRARHRASVLAYARLCTTSESTARQLATQAFTLAARETARGTDPAVPLRHHLLLLTVRVATDWAADERSAGLDAGLLLVLNTAGPVGPVPPMLAAYQSLPSRTQGQLWYAVVEREPDERTATLLGRTREDVTYGTEQALQALGRACLTSRLAASDDPRCRDFRRLIEEAVRPDGPRHSPDLDAHMARCVHCATAYEELTALRDSPRTALAEGLLPWAGTVYVTRDGDPGVHLRIRQRNRPPYRRRLALTSAVLGAALVPLLVVLLAPGETASQDRTDPGPTTTPVVPPPVTVTATVSASPPTPTTKSPSPTRSSTPPHTPSPKPSPTPPPTHPPSGSYAQVVNVASGLCLDIRDGVLEKGTDVVTAPCGASPTQRWRVDAGRGVVQSSADPDYCLDSRGSTDKGVGIWECASVDGRNGQNLKFAVGGDGVIRPAVAVETAVTPDGDGGLALLPVNGGSGQRWRAGAA
ncbi:RICIN domain-containing protein [Streptomyces sp. NPDC059862]|uniref:RICIN domain-containing protein n=1 Tax=Streptomyces sp. NPDC059862 TaxID=3346975 RepID=UPI00366821CC